MDIPLKILSDEKGYFDRECPNIECEFLFKILMEDWENKVSDEIVFCPRCGHTDSSDQWWTKEQVKHVEEIALSWAMSHIQDTLDKSFRKMSRKSGKYIKIAYKPGKKISFVNNPLGQREEWEMEITCEKCGTRTSVIGTAYFCPCCGHNAVDRVFKESLSRITLQLKSIDEMELQFVNMFDKDVAVSMRNSIIESSLKEVISAFQKYAVEMFRKGSDKKVRPNDFQMIEKGSNLFANHYGSDYATWLSTEEINFLVIMFQRRHILEHNQGIVDERYLINSGDTSYNIGQRIVCKVQDVEKLVDKIKILSDGVASVVESEKNSK